MISFGVRGWVEERVSVRGRGLGLGQDYGQFRYGKQIPQW